MCACVCVCASVHVCIFMLVHPFLSVVYVHSVFQVGVFEANVVHPIFAFLRQSVMSMFYYCTKYAGGYPKHSLEAVSRILGGDISILLRHDSTNIL